MFESKQSPSGLVTFAPRDGVPVLAAYRETSSQADYLHVWCKHCEKLHSHGGGGENPLTDDTHRVAHCVAINSPYQQRGYFLREVGSFPREWEALKTARVQALL
jgi:hypothetical protein